tara:strand:+ start:1652 stop:6577 length:4926 start_codon:yes stop_codon:yes gene_type:complete
MSEKTPVRVNYDNAGNAIGFAELQGSEFIGLDDGGTGSTTASGARTALGLALGSDVMAYDADLAALAGLSHSDGNFIVSNGSTWIVESGSTVRDSLGLGTSNSPTFTNLTLSNDLTVTGDLTVQGDTTTINTSTVTVEDVLMKLGSGNASDAVDLGWYGQYSESSTTKYLGFTWDASVDKFILWTGNQSEPNTLVDTGGTGHATGTLVANLEGNVTGNVTGTVSSLSGLTTANLTEGANLYYTDERVDDRVNALIIGGAGVDTAYDDSAGTLTLTADLSEVTTDLNERVDDRVGSLLVDSATSGIDISYDDSNDQLTISADLSEITTDLNERVDDRVDSLLTAGSNVSLTYDDAAGTLTIASTDTNTQLTQEQVEDFVNGVIVGGTNVTATYDDTAGTLTLSSTDTNTQLTQEQVEDFVGGMLDGTETLISVSYDDTDGNIDFVVDNDLANYSNTNSAFITKSGISVTDAGGDGSLAYNNGTGVITYTGPSQAEVLAHVSAGTGITISGSGAIATTITQYANSDVQSYLSGGTGVTMSGSGEFSIGQAVATTDNVTFNNLVLDGNLTVNGATTAVESTTVTINDPLVRYADNNSGNSVDFGFYGKYVQSSTTKYGGIVWDASQSDKFRLFHGLQSEPTTTVDISGTGYATGTLIANLEGNVTGTVSSISNFDTDNLSEGSSNLYYTDARARASISVTDSGGDGALAYNSSTGVITYTGPSQAEVLAHISGGTGIAVSGSGVISTSITQYADSDVQSYLSAGSGIALSGSGQISSTITQYADSDVESYISGGTGIDFSSGAISIDSTVVTESSTDTLTNKTVNLENNTVIVEYAVTASGGNFLIDGEANATISFRPGVVHRFDLSDSSVGSHPFKLSTTSNGSHNSGSEYTTGKTTNGSQGSSGAYVEYTVNAATPDILYYYCSSHSGMGGTITVFGSAYGDADVQSYLSAGTGITLSGSGVIATTITQYADSDVQSYLSAGTGITLSGSGVIASSITQYADSDVASYLSSNSYATQSYVDTEVANLVDSAPGTLDTLNELAAALGDDANFSTTVTNSIATKLATSDFTSTANTWLGTKDTDDLSEGSSNLYYTDARVQSYLSGGNGITMSGSGAFSVDATAITGQTAETSIADDDLILIYDDSASALRKMTKANFTAGLTGGGGTVTEAFRTIAVSGQTDIVADSATDSLTFAAGSNITLTTNASSDTVTIAATDTNTQLTTEQVQDIVGGMVDGGTETNISVTYDDTNGKINFVSTDTNTQLTQEQVEDFVNGVIVAGANISKTYDDAAGTLTIAATGGAANAFSTFAVSGQSNVVADSTTDTMTFVAGTGMTLTTDASGDSITFTSSSSGGGGTLPFTEFDGSTDNIVLSSAVTGGSLPLTLAGTGSDPIAMTATQQTLTAYADADDDTKIEVERTTDNDTVHVKAGGTDVITATSSGVTITNLTVTGTTTQANELKITDTLFELNADGGSLTTDAGMIVERGSTGANAAFIWDESADSWVAGTTTTDGSAAANVSYTLGDLQAKTQNQSDNSTKVATTAYVDTATSGISSDTIKDADNDTKIEVENSDADEVVITTAGQERAKVDNNISMSARGGFFTHNLTMHASETYTIASTEGTVAAGPLDIQGTVDCQGTLVIV